METSSIDWLIEVEDASLNVCQRGADAFSDDPELSCLLDRLSAEEKSHHYIMCAVRDFLIQSGSDLPGLDIDEDTRERIEGRLIKCRLLLDSGEITRGEILGLMVEMEFSEFNDRFLSLLNNIKCRCAGFRCPRYDLYRSRLTIKRYLEGHVEAGELLERINAISLPPADNILIVDDNEMVVEFLTGILADRGCIETAPDGDEAARMIAEKYYGAVISDVDMPVMDGVELFKRASAVFPGIKDRFLFLMSSIDSQSVKFIKDSGLKYLGKPSSKVEILEAVDNIIAGRYEIPMAS